MKHGRGTVERLGGGGVDLETVVELSVVGVALVAALAAPSDVR